MSDQHIAGYRGAHERLVGLLGDRSDAADLVLPACPGWTVRDVVAHLAGLVADWIDGNLDAYATDAWTAAQIVRFDGSDLMAILDAWTASLEQFSALPDDPVMGPPARWAFGDAVVHEADVRGALDGPRVPDGAVALALKGTIARWRQTAAGASLATFEVRSPGWRAWWIGQPVDGEHLSVDVDAYELFRALAGRRTREQAASWSWSADATAVLDAGLPYPFTWAAIALTD